MRQNWKFIYLFIRSHKQFKEDLVTGDQYVYMINVQPNIDSTK